MRQRGSRESPEMLGFLQMRNEKAAESTPAARFNAGLG